MRIGGLKQNSVRKINFYGHDDVYLYSKRLINMKKVEKTIDKIVGINIFTKTYDAVKDFFLKQINHIKQVKN